MKPTLHMLRLYFVQCSNCNGLHLESNLPNPEYPMSFIQRDGNTSTFVIFTTFYLLIRMCRLSNETNKTECCFPSITSNSHYIGSTAQAASSGIKQRGLLMKLCAIREKNPHPAERATHWCVWHTQTFTVPAFLTDLQIYYDTFRASLQHKTSKVLKKHLRTINHVLVVIDPNCIAFWYDFMPTEITKSI
jgi:hypothetical protein